MPVTAPARAVQTEGEHASPGGVPPTAAAQRKRRPRPKKYTCHGAHPAYSRVTNGFHEGFVFCLFGRHGNRPLYPLCTDAQPVGFAYLALRVERRGNQQPHWSARAGHASRARTRQPRTGRPKRSRRAKEAPACSQFWIVPFGKGADPFIPLR